MRAIGGLLIHVLVGARVELRRERRPAAVHEPTEQPGLALVAGVAVVVRDGHRLPRRREGAHVVHLGPGARLQAAVVGALHGVPLGLDDALDEVDEIELGVRRQRAALGVPAGGVAVRLDLDVAAAVELAAGAPPRAGKGRTVPWELVGGRTPGSVHAPQLVHGAAVAALARPVPARYQERIVLLAVRCDVAGAPHVAAAVVGAVLVATERARAVIDAERAPSLLHERAEVHLAIGVAREGGRAPIGRAPVVGRLPFIEGAVVLDLHGHPVVEAPLRTAPRPGEGRADRGVVEVVRERRVRVRLPRIDHARLELDSGIGARPGRSAGVLGARADSTQRVRLHPAVAREAPIGRALRPRLRCGLPRGRQPRVLAEEGQPARLAAGGAPAVAPPEE